MGLGKGLRVRVKSVKGSSPPTNRAGWQYRFGGSIDRDGVLPSHLSTPDMMRPPGSGLALVKVVSVTSRVRGKGKG